MTTELLCRPSHVSKFQVQLANRAIYLCDNRDPINQGHVVFLVFHVELTTFSDGQLSKVSARPTVFNWELYEGRTANKSLEFAILPAAQGSKSSINIVVS